MNTESNGFVKFMRYFSVAIVTVTFLSVLIMVSGLEEADLDIALFIFILIYTPLFILIFTFLFFITLPITVFWIYSFIKSVRRRSETDKRLLWLHIADLIIFVVIIILYNCHEQKFNADMMAEHYEQHGDSMRKLAADTKAILPDTAILHIEFGEVKDIGKVPYLTGSQSAELQKRLKDIGCIGLDINRQSHSGTEYSSVRFRRIGMGMYSFRLYDNALTRQERDSLNNNECLIVYDDSTVFEFGGGAFGVQHFVDKEEFLIKHHRMISNENERDQ